jgi:hypothetical protein
VRDDLEIPPPGYRVARRAGGLDPATKRLATIAAGIGGALVVLVGIWSMVGGNSTGVPVVQAPPGPMRVKPANPGGMKVAGANEQILGGGSARGQPALAPPPETPDLQALQNAPAASPAKVAATEDAAAPPPVASAPAPAIAANGLPLPPPAPPPLELAAASTVAPPPAAIGTGTATEVQLAAMSSENGAKREWQKLQADLPNLLGGRQPLISKVEVAGHTFWRVRTAGFASVAEATSFCAAIRAKGKGCAIAAF